MPKEKKNTQKSGKTTRKNTKVHKEETKAKAVKQAPVEKKSTPSFLTQAAPYIMAVIAVLIGVCVIIGEGQIGGGIKNILTGLFGGAAYALPLFLLLRTFFWARDIEEGQNAGRTACTVIVFFMITMTLHLIGGGIDSLSPVDHYKNGNLLVGGGVVGGILGELLKMGFGKVCALIIVFATMVFLSLYIVGVTPKGVFIYIAYKIKFAKEKRLEKEEKKKNAPKSKSKIREEEYLEYLRDKKAKERELKKQENEAASQNEQGVKEEKQIPIPTVPSVYKFKKKRKADIEIPEEFDDPVTSSEDDGIIPVMDDGVSYDEEGENSSLPYVADEFDDDYDEDQVKEALLDTSVDQDAVDEKIFDEVMRRTRERIEKSRKAEGAKGVGFKAARDRGNGVSEADDFEGASDGLTDEIKAGDVLDAVEIASIGIREKAAMNKEKVADDVTDTLKLASSINTDESENFDVSKFFVNPEDAELLDKLSQTYRSTGNNSLGVQRSSVSQQKGSASSQFAAAPEYKFPPIEILEEDAGGGNENIKEELQDNAVKLVETLKSFNVRTKIENISRGPTITRYELLPEPGTRVRSIVNLVDDIALNLATTGVRIEAPIPGKSAVGIEVPNKKQTTVHLRTLIEDNRFTDSKSKLTVCLGENVAGEAVYFDIAKMPHLLIAGATGMGKSVCINSIITSLLYKASPEDVKLILIDPKKVELSIYNGIPHLLVPVVSEPKKAAGSLSWAVGEMERRFGLIEAVGVRDIKMFNEVTKNDPDYEYMPRIVIVIDELADLMMTAPDDVEESICRLAQKARAAGMHLIIGTQRPSVDVITGLIKANIPSRIAFTVSSQVDSRTIIDRGGAENLIGRGDMLFNPVGAQKPMRVQGAYVSEADVEEVVAYIKNMNSYAEVYSEEVANQIEREAQKCGAGKKGSAAAAVDEVGDEDPMLKSAIELAIESGKISTSLIQRRLSLGYGRAAKLIDRMEQLGYVSAPDGQKPREVLITKQDYMEMRLKDEAPFDL